MKRKIIVITGLTASGKTKLSIELAHKIDAEIICADSRIVYKGLDIVSAKPALSEREGIKHHLVDILEPDRDFSAGDFVSRARNIIENTSNNIIISGGTWFYIKSLLSKEGLIESSKDAALRDELEKLSSEVLWDKLNNLDSARAKLIHPNNRDKVIRSIEMCVQLDNPVSSSVRPQNKDYGAKWFMPEFEREEIYQKINSRVDKMIEMGLYDEWRCVSAKYSNSKILENTIGYREFYDLKDGKYKDFKEAVLKIKQHTRNFAKRQITYFKTRPDIKAVQDIDDILKDLKD